MIMKEYLEPTYYIDSDSITVKNFVKKYTSPGAGDKENGVKLFYAVRDTFRYNPYSMTLDREKYRGSYLLKVHEGFCIQKAILLAAAARCAGIPSRLNFANVINHLSTEHLRELLKTDLFVFHGSTEIYLNGRWVKATPAFNISLCEKFGVLPLDFDGESDSLFHPFDRNGNRHMEYVHDYGSFADFPLDLMLSELKKYYPHIFKGDIVEVNGGNFESEINADLKKNNQGI
jgi:transglutaminase-like putative cysteine protease